MKTYFPVALASAWFALLLAACTSPTQPISEAGAPSPASAAQMALMATHDSLMAQTSELYTQRDHLAGYHTEAVAPYIRGLLAADAAMSAWMRQYKLPDSTATAAVRLAYLQQQQQALGRIRGQYRATLDSARRFRAEHPAAGDAASTSAN